MPVTLEHFFANANAVSDTAQVFLQNGGEAVGNATSLHGIHKLSSSAKAAENRATVTAFMNALEASPQFRNINQDMRNMLDERLAGGKPLTAGDVRLVRDSVLLDQAMTFGRNFAADGTIPAGHGTSFAQFAVVRNMDLNTPQGIGQAVHAYLAEKVIPQNLGELTTLTEFGNRSEAMSNVLRKLSEPLAGADGFFARALRADIEQNGPTGAFERLQRSFLQGNAGNAALLSGMNDELFRQVPRLSNNKDIMAALREALPSVGEGKVNGLAMSLIMSEAPLTTPTQRREAIVAFQMRESVKGGTLHTAMTDTGLPGNFDTALGNHPEVVRAAKALLAAEPGTVPTQARVDEALNLAVRRFVEDRLPLLRELAIMGQDPPAGLNPPVTAETMPRYLNAMLEGDAMLEPLLNDSVDTTDRAFLDRLAAHAEALNSATHSFRGDFGADDVANVLKNSVAMLLARRGVTQDMLPAIMDKAVRKFGAIANDLSTLNGAIQRGAGGAAGIAFMREGMTLFRSLEGHGRVLMSLMSREQQVELGVAVPGDVDPQSEDIQRQDGELKAAFLEERFEAAGDPDELPNTFREFVTDHGLTINPMRPEIAERLARRQEADLSLKNTQIVDGLVDEFIPENGNLIEPHTPEFLALFDAAEEGALDGLDPALVDARSFSLGVKEATRALIGEATAAGRELDPAEVRQAIREAIGGGLLALKATLDAIDALPNADPRHPDTTFSAADKAAMKAVAQRYGVRDANAVGAMFKAAANAPIASGLIGLADLEGAPERFVEAMADLATAYADKRGEFAGPLEGAEDMLPMMCSFALRGLSQEQLEHVVANLRSDTAAKIAGTCIYAVTRQENPRGNMVLMSLTQVMTKLMEIAGTEAGMDVEMAPLAFTDEIDHLSEMPRSAGAPLERLARLAPGVITEFDVRMSRHGGELTPQQWEQLRGVNEQLGRTAEGGHLNFLLPYWVESSAEDLLAALEANGGRPLSDRQLWEVMVGGPMPRGVRSGHFAADMERVVDQRYRALLRAAAPHLHDAQVNSAIIMQATTGLNPRKLFALAQPHARLTRDDVSLRIDMGSLSAVTPENAYGLVTDFRRRGQNTVMHFEDRNGNGFETSPFDIPDAQNTPGNPHFESIIARVRGMTHSEAQLARVMQCFSQAPLIMPRVLSTCFPGIELNEHGNFSVSAVEQRDGTVLVDIHSDPTLPLRLDMQFQVEQDGSHTCTAFEMRRP